MKKLIILITALFIYTACKQATPHTPAPPIADGFYEVMQLGTDTSHFGSLPEGQTVIVFDTLFNPEEYTRAVIDTQDYVPLELERLPAIEKQTEMKNLLSITLTEKAAEKIKTFTASRVMKRVAVVLDGKAITMHVVKAAITGRQMQITRCNDNACDYLFVKMKANVK